MMANELIDKVYYELLEDRLNEMEELILKLKEYVEEQKEYEEFKRLRYLKSQ